LSLTGSFFLPAPDNLFEVASGGASIAGALLEATNAAMVLGANMLLVDNPLTSLTSNPLFRFRTSTSITADSLVHVGPQGSISAAGPLIAATNASLATRNGPLVLVDEGGSLDVTIAAANPLIGLQSSLLSAAGSVLDLQNSRLALTGPVVELRQQSRFANRVGPVLRLNGGSLSAKALFSTDGNGNRLHADGSVQRHSHVAPGVR
jgi:hypothetical protein